MSQDNDTGRYLVHDGWGDIDPLHSFHADEAEAVRVARERAWNGWEEDPDTTTIVVLDTTDGQEVVRFRVFG